MPTFEDVDFDTLLSQSQDNDIEQTRAAERGVIDILETLHHAEFSGDTGSIHHYESIICFVANFYRVFVSLMMNPHHHFSRESMRHICFTKPILEMIVMILNIKDPGAVHRSLQAMAEQHKMDQLAERHLMLLTPTSSVAFGDDLGYTLWEECTPPAAVCAYLGAISQRMYVSKSAEKFKRMVQDRVRFDYSYIRQGVKLNLDYFNVPGMYITYDHEPMKRHDVRRHFNALMKQYLERHNCYTEPVRYKANKRPRMTIFAERFHHEHVMFRNYSKKVIAIIKDFEVTIVADHHTMCSDDMKRILKGATFVEHRGGCSQTLINLIQYTQPDIMCYMSVAVTHESKLLSLLRLAPMQLMFLGHPDSTQSPEMDFVICGSNFIQKEHKQVESLWSERFLAVKGKNGNCEAYMKNYNEDSFEPYIRPNVGELVHIAIIATSIKLNTPYFEFLEGVVAASPIPIQYHFFPNVQGLEYLAITGILIERFPNANVLPPQLLEPYMSCLTKCDLAIGSFPFGGSNCITDAFVCGVPMASLVGTEPHEISEYFTHCLVGTETTLCAHNQDDLLEIVLKLITDNAFRVQLSEQVLSRRDTQFDATDDIHYFSKAIKWAYDHFEEIQRSDQRTFILGPEELEALEEVEEAEALEIL